MRILFAGVLCAAVAFGANAPGRQPSLAAGDGMVAMVFAREGFGDVCRFF